MQNQVIRQPFQGVERGWAAIGPAGGVHCTRVAVEKSGSETALSVTLTYAAGAGKKPVVRRQGVQCERLRHGDALTLE